MSKNFVSVGRKGRHSPTQSVKIGDLSRLSNHINHSSSFPVARNHSVASCSILAATSRRSYSSTSSRTSSTHLPPNNHIKSGNASIIREKNPSLQSKTARNPSASTASSNRGTSAIPKPTSAFNRVQQHQFTGNYGTHLSITSPKTHLLKKKNWFLPKL